MAAKKGPDRKKAKKTKARDDGKGPVKGAGDQDGNKRPSFIGRLARDIVSRLAADVVKEAFGDMFGDVEFGPKGDDGDDEDDEDGGGGDI
jgi:hypothetical protein